MNGGSVTTSAVGSRVAAAQRDLVATVDRERAAEPVCERLARHLAVLRRGDVDAADLVVTQRVSKRADEYERDSRAKAALERAAALDFERHRGQSVEYVVVDDDRSGPDRVRLAFEDGDEYDPDFYADRLVRACIRFRPVAIRRRCETDFAVYPLDEHVLSTMVTDVCERPTVGHSSGGSLRRGSGTTSSTRRSSIRRRCSPTVAAVQLRWSATSAWVASRGSW